MHNTIQVVFMKGLQNNKYRLHYSNQTIDNIHTTAILILTLMLANVIYDSFTRGPIPTWNN